MDAERLIELQTIWSKINSLSSNFSKKGLHLRTVGYIDKEKQRLQKQYGIYQTLSERESDNPLITHTITNIR